MPVIVRFRVWEFMGEDEELIEERMSEFADKVHTGEADTFVPTITAQFEALHVCLTVAGKSILILPELDIPSVIASTK